MSIKVYGNCKIAGERYLVNIAVTGIDRPCVNAEGDLRTLDTYFDELRDIGLIGKPKDSVKYNIIRLSIGEEVDIEGELSDKPETGYFWGFKARIRIVDISEIQDIRIKTAIDPDYYFIVNNFIEWRRLPK